MALKGLHLTRHTRWFAFGRFFEETYELKTGRPVDATRGLEDRMQVGLRRKLEALMQRFRFVGANMYAVLSRPRQGKCLCKCLRFGSGIKV